MTFIAITSTAQSEADGSQPDFIFHAATFIFITSHNHRNTQLVVRLCSPRYPGGQEQEALSPALSQRPPFRQRIFRHGSLQISQCLPACTHTKRAFNNSPGSTFSTLKHIRIHSHTHTFKLGCADTLIGIDEIPTGGVVLARGRQTLIVLLLTVQAMVALTGHRFIQFRIKSQSL